MDDSLFRAILAMDAYNQGYAPGLKGVGGKIGKATILKDALDKTIFPEGAAQAAGFYAVAYELADGSKVISYRGTGAGGATGSALARRRAYPPSDTKSTDWRRVRLAFGAGLQSRREMQPVIRPIEGRRTHRWAMGLAQLRSLSR